MSHNFDPTRYGPTLQPLLAGDRLPELGPGSPSSAARAALRQLSPEKLFAGQAPRDIDMARCCLAALWLHHDFLDESHTVSQEVGTPSGSYWHGIMHRREPDAGNSKYWFHRVGPHPVIDMLIEQAPAIGFAYESPLSFIDECERVRGTGTAAETLARRVQRLEWQLLFDWCWQRAA